MARKFAPDRWIFLETSSAAAFAMAGGLLAHAGFAILRGANAQAPSRKPDHIIRIAPLAHEIAPGRFVKTTACNGLVPGPPLRLQEGKPVTIHVNNESGYPNLIHWRGLRLPSNQDGATEEGSPIVEPAQSLIYAFTPKPSGTRWRHSHAMTMEDLSESTYSGEFGFLIIDPAAGDSGRHDREVLLASHIWVGEWVCLQFIMTRPPPEAAAAPDETIHLKFENIAGGRGGYNRWTINGAS